ncbi:MAG TPA: glycoside hydrolase family 15 protein [Acidimicrobiales bacterium]|jgi:GH15 family glucan-1,4-alpha-glucosidase|nr:glycoside hydrolase family 15 protein [Acidimicrobiales bacterium]
MSQRIEDYAVIGDLHTAALVGLDGSVDWLCLPHFDSPSCFTRLLGADDHGFWKIAPVGAPATLVATRRWYRADTLVLETEFDTPTGTVRITDCMPVRDNHPHLVRTVEGVSGSVDMLMELTVRFDYGEVVPWVTTDDGLSRFTAGPDSIALWHRVELEGKGLSSVASFTVTQHERFPFTLVWYPSHEEPPPPLDSYYAVHLTEAYWSEWAELCCYNGPYKDAVVRSLITLKALTYEPTGGIVAAATTSLPEALGGNRNWDYRFCWLRDATLTLEALMRGGYFTEAMAWRDWLLRAVAGDVSKLQIMYGAAGERRLDEWEADWLPGYENSVPVRIGNAASEQYQLDVYGEVMSALYSSAHSEGVHSRAAWALQTQLIDFIETGWTEPDDGIWEVRGPRRHFTHSKVMAWVAVDRAVRTLEQWPELEGPLDKWRTLRDDIFNEVCQKGYNEEVGAFTQYYGCNQLDASVLMIPLVGFLPPEDPRVVSTVEAIQRELVDHGFVLRYRTSDDGAVDGLTGREGAFLACSFWLVDCLHMIGREDEAVDLFERLLALRNELGLLSEEYDPYAGRLVGNFPQAFSHVSLINSAFRLGGTDPLVPMRSEERTVDNRSVTAPVMQRMKKMSRVGVKRRAGAQR